MKKASFSLLVGIFAVLMSTACGGGGIPATSIDNASLSGLTISEGMLNPAFSSETISYTAMFITETSVTVTPTASDAGAAITVNGAAVSSG